MDQSAEIIEGVAAKPVKSWAIRAMLGKDIRTYCALFQRIFAKPPWNETWTLDGIDVEVRKIMRKEGFIGIVAEYDSQPVGYVTGYRLPTPPIIPPLCYLDQLFVDDRYHDLGIGKSLLAKMVCLGSTRRDYGIVLLTKAHSPAERFYLGNGFKRLPLMIRFNGKVLLYKLLQ